MKNFYLTSHRSNDIPTHRPFGSPTFPPKERRYLSTSVPTSVLNDVSLTRPQGAVIVSAQLRNDSGLVGDARVCFGR